MNCVIWSQEALGARIISNATENTDVTSRLNWYLDNNKKKPKHKKHKNTQTIDLIKS